MSALRILTAFSVSSSETLPEEIEDGDGVGRMGLPDHDYGEYPYSMEDPRKEQRKRWRLMPHAARAAELSFITHLWKIVGEPATRDTG